MVSDYAIYVNNLNKCYRIYKSPLDRLKQCLFKNKQLYQEFWALKDISFKVKKGKAIGIIGANGSGKSTLLQIICGTLHAFEGELNVNGRISALLELGSGFNPEFTGRENIFINAAILGLQKEEIDKRYDEIVNFAEIGDFIDLPVKTYSTGMLVRLAFSVQVAVEPDILVVDEALSVGDIFFQQKCMRRMKKLRESGVTILFVSHDLSVVRDFCDKTIYLKQGMIEYYGSNQNAIQRFIQEDVKSSLLSKKCKFNSHKTLLSNSDFINEFKKNAVWIRKEEDMNKDQKAEILGVSVVDEQNNLTMTSQIGGNFIFKILYQVYSNDPLHITLVIKNRYDQIIYCGGTYTMGINLPSLSIGDIAFFEQKITNMIEAGSYTFLIELGENIGIKNKGILIDKTPWLGPLMIKWNYENKIAPFFGMFGIPNKGKFLNLQGE